MIVNRDDTSKVAHAIFIGICKAFDIIPVSEEQSRGEEVYHTVVAGDTLWAISKRYEVTLNNIVSLNDIPNVNLIIPGQKIKVSKHIMEKIIKVQKVDIMRRFYIINFKNIISN